MKTLIAVVLGCLVPGLALAQGAKVVSFRGIVRGSGPCGITAQKPLGINSVLGNSCHLTSSDPKANVQIECINGATLQLLTGGFDAIIVRGGVPDCVLELPLGSAMATSSGQQNQPGGATIKTGALAAVVTGTSVVVTVPPSGAANATAYVLEGEALIARAGVETKLGAGQMTYAKSTAVNKTPPDRLNWVADNLAVASTAGVGIQVTPDQQTALKNSFLAVYTDTKSATARKALTQNLDAVHAPQNSFRRYQATQALKLNQAAQYVRPIGGNQVPAPAPAPHPAAVIPGAMIANHGTFNNPTLNGRRVDYCLHWGVDCGPKAADAFCRAKNYTSAVTSAVAENIGAQTPTLVIGDNKICRDATCDGFAVIRCQ